MAQEVLLLLVPEPETLVQIQLGLALQQLVAAAAEQMARLVAAEVLAVAAAGLTPAQVDQERLDKAMLVARVQTALTQTLARAGVLAQSAEARAHLFNKLLLAVLV